jgi:hypothetical protein
VETHAFNVVRHLTEFDDGHAQTTLTMAGTWHLDLPGALPDYTGRFVIHESSTASQAVDTVTIAAPFIARGSDGSRFRAIFQLQFVIVDGTAVVERVSSRTVAGRGDMEREAPTPVLGCAGAVVKPAPAA